MLERDFVMRLLALLLLPLALGACEVGRIKLPMTVGPSDTSLQSCARAADGTVPADCKAPAAR
jgi:hypothetical protein